MGRSKSEVWQNEADISWIDRNRPVIAFTFDDGPIGAEKDAYSIRIQNVMSEYKQHCTFFYWGERIDVTTRTEIKRAYDLGLEVGNHGYTHPHLIELTEEEIQEEINRTKAILQDITGQTRFLIRPPFGEVDQKVRAVCGAPLINWSVDTRDWDNGTFNSTVGSVLPKVQDGDIVLMHEPYESTAEAVEYMVPYLVNKGYQIASVSELMKVKGIQMIAGELYEAATIK